MLLMYLGQRQHGIVFTPRSHTHWSKNGSKIMTSSPCSMKPMNALSIPFHPMLAEEQFTTAPG